MNRWFRVYEDLLDDPKVQRLPGELFKMLLNLWCLTSRNDGVLPPIEDIAFALRQDHVTCVNTLKELQKRGLIDNDSETLKPHNWDGRQFRSDVSTERVRKFRKRKRNADETVNETPPDTDSESDTDTDTDTEGAYAPKSRARATPVLVKNLSADWPADYREQFRALYPLDQDMTRGLAALEATKRDGKVSWKILIEHVASIPKTVPPDRMQLAKNYLEQERWNDKPARTNGKHEPRHVADELAEEARRRESEGRGSPVSVGGAELGGDHAQVVSSKPS